MALSDFNLITDRTQADVDRYTELRLKYLSGMTAEEKAEWETHLKGAYNYTDMNRVESAVEYVANRLTEAGYGVIPVVKKNWTLTDKPTLVDLNRYMKNISDIRSVLATYETTPEAPTTERRLSFQAANAIEQILADVDELVSKMVSAYFYSNDLYSGEV
jgi:hypothetical protein